MQYLKEVQHKSMHLKTNQCLLKAAKASNNAIVNLADTFYFHLHFLSLPFFHYAELVEILTSDYVFSFHHVGLYFIRFQ